MNFYSLSNKVLGTLVGFLIGVPLISHNKYFPLIFLVLGFLLGNKKKDDRTFFYVSLISSCILLLLVSSKI